MSIAENLEKIEEGISAACVKSGRERREIQLVAVSKTKPNQLIADAIAAGQVVFGENKVQELIVKQPEFPADIRWHLIGHLQKNKIRKVLPCIDLLETMDSVGLAERVNRISGELEITCSVLLQVNISNDDAKYGFTKEEVEGALSRVQDFKSIRVKGLMTIPVFDPDPEKTRTHFANLRELRDKLEQKSGFKLPELSMGMSHDYMVAIEEGASLVRVGSAIFGSRE